MRTPSLQLASALLLSSAAASSKLPLDCVYGRAAERCNEPLGAVTAVVPGSLYFAKLPCLDCKVDDRTQTQNESALFFNITRSHDLSHLLLNSQPVFPSLATSPHPPYIYTNQVPLNYSRTNLEEAIDCREKRTDCWRFEPSLGANFLDYDYAAKQLDMDPDADWEKWEVTFDAIGHSGEAYNRSDQLMLRIEVGGKKKPMYKDGYTEDTPTDPSLFGPPRPALEWKYDFQIVNVELVERGYMFPVQRPRTFWGSIRHFFGCDIEGENGHIVFRFDEWDMYGQHGTLRNEVGKIIHDWPWDVIGLAVGGVLGSALVLYGTYWLYLLGMQQKELARWKGIDAVWERMRQEPNQDEADGLLAGGYRDYIDDDAVYDYTDEAVANKPLPAKPLPDKPLPPLPLIEA